MHVLTHVLLYRIGGHGPEVALNELINTGSKGWMHQATAYNAEVMAKRLPADSLRYKRWSDMAPRA